MRLGKLFSAAAAAAMISVLFVMPVSAHHGHHRQAAAVDTRCPVCTVEGCEEEGRHYHDNECYCGYDHEGGYCDGSCGAVYVQPNSGYGCGGRHHCRY